MEWKGLHAGSVDCLTRLWEAGYAAYPVGGCVRDLLLGRAPGDVDICTAAHPEAVMSLFPAAVPTGLKHGTVTVPTGTGNVEVTTFRREGGYADARHPDAVSFDVGLREDLSRRDFTVNAMALGRSGEVIDPFGGREDLKRKLVRCVGDPDKRFSEDALRMFRALRFCAQLGFITDHLTYTAIGRNAHLAGKVSKERIKAELEKILLSPMPEEMSEVISAGLLRHLHSFPPMPFLREALYEELRPLPATPGERWRGFCKITGFPINVLPVERSLRRAVEHPELELIPTLALKPADLMAMGLEGPEISAAQRKLALYVLEHPGENEKKRLKELLRKWNL